MTADDEPQGTDEWVAALHLIAVLAPLAPEERERAIAEALRQMHPAGELAADEQRGDDAWI